MGKWLIPVGIIGVGFLTAWAGYKLAQGATGNGGSNSMSGFRRGARLGQVALTPEPEYVENERAKAILLSL